MKFQLHSKLKKVITSGKKNHTLSADVEKNTHTQHLGTVISGRQTVAVSASVPADILFRFALFLLMLGCTLNYRQSLEANVASKTIHILHFPHKES